MPSSTPVPPPIWQAAKKLYEQLADLPGAQQQARLAAADVDEATRAEVRSLLAHNPERNPAAGGPAGFLEAGAVVELLDGTERVGQRLGAWQIVRPLGSGGMGDVFEAHRADGSYEGRAAIKLLKRGMDSGAILQRFTQERQALARLHHGGIAMLLDAGLSADGLPYFVMEYVDGKHIDEACFGLAIEQRLGLFLQLADAVAYAHGKLLVHRDLKPGNVLVTAQGQVKLLDFGIAKALDPAEGSPYAAGETTLASQRPFTPHYASPEQVRGDPVTTGTDIYSLGVLLYQLLTGLRPTGRGAATAAEMARSVLEEEPTRPSNLTPDMVADPNWATTRRHLKGDLDNILLMALEKPVERRYSSVEALAKDIRRFLAGRPVSARPRTWAYVLQKFFARHRLTVALGAAAVVALCTTTGVAVWQAHQAQHERQNAQQHLDDVRSLAKTMIFDVGDALNAGATPGRAALLKAATEYLGRRINATDLSLAESLELVDSLRRMADLEGNSRLGLAAQPEQAQKRYRQALEVHARMSVQGSGSAAWWYSGGATRRSLALLQMAQGQAQASYDSAGAARAQIERAVALEPAVARNRRMACMLFTAQADALYSAQGMPHLGRLADSIAALRDGQTCATHLLGQFPDDPVAAMTAATVLTRLSQALLMGGHLAEGVAVAERDLDLMASWRVRAPQNVLIARLSADAHWLRGYALLKSGPVAQGLAAMGEGVDLARKLMRQDPLNDPMRRYFVEAAAQWGWALTGQGQHAAALAVCEEARSAARADAASASRDTEAWLLEGALARCLSGAQLGLRQSGPALQSIDAYLSRAPAAAASGAGANTPRRIKDAAWAAMLRARALQQLGQGAASQRDVESALAGATELLRVDAANMESRGEAARLLAQAAQWGAAAGSQQRQQTCRWAAEADAQFKALADSARLGSELADDARRVGVQAGHCTPVPG